MNRFARFVVGLLALVSFASAVPAAAQSTPDPFAVDDPAVTDMQRRPGQDGVGGVGADERATSGLYALQGGYQAVLAGPVDPAVYVVGPGDVFLLQVWGKVSQSLPIEVGPEGTALVPGSAVVYMAGRTFADVKADVLRRMQQQYRGVSMDLRLARPRSFRVYLTGQVFNPGPIIASGALRVGDVVTRSQLLGDASRRRIELRHTDGTREFCDLELFLRTGDGSSNPWLRDGDVIQVPAATEFVWVQGAVARPGRFEAGLGDSLLDLLHLAGDPLPAAQVNRALLVRFKGPFMPESLWVSLTDIYSRKLNLPLEDGVRLYVYYIPEYRQQHEAAIMGEVQRPGVYPIREGKDRLSQLVGSAGGFRPTADLSAIRVHRKSKASQERDPELDRMLRLSRKDLTATEYEVMRMKLAALGESFRVDWNRLQADQNLDLLLFDGDTVFVERLVSSIRVDGEVRRPGMLNYVAGSNIEHYVKLAGGFTDRAWRGKVRVTRAVTGQTLLAHNIRTLDPGDFVWVPEKPDVTAWEQTREIMTALAQVATIIIAIQSVN